jgi:hypothetical protein
MSNVAPAGQVEFRECMCIGLCTFRLTSHIEAMDRIHRLGQRRPVQAIKLVIEDSIESRIVQLQDKKSAMVDATLSTDDSVRVSGFPRAKIADSYGTLGDGPTYSRRRTYALLSCHCAILIMVFPAVFLIQSIFIPFNSGVVSTDAHPS